MSNERVKELLTQLRTELGSADVDAETLELMRKFDHDIHRTLEAGGGATDALSAHGEALIARAKEIQVRFSVRHRVADRILREIVDTLAKIGV